MLGIQFIIALAAGLTNSYLAGLFVGSVITYLFIKNVLVLSTTKNILISIIFPTATYLVLLIFIALSGIVLVKLNA